MGHRISLARRLETMGIPYLLWTEKPVLNKLHAKKIIIKKFPAQKSEICDLVPEYAQITHVIAAVERSVIPASNTRLWFKLKRNPHSLILKCTDKYRMKKYLYEKNIPMTEFCSVVKNELDKEHLIDKFGWPIVCKPRLSSGGRGIEFIQTLEGLFKHKASEYYYEKAIVGKEGSVESFIHNGEVIFTNITEYFENGHCNKIPGRYSKEILGKIKTLNTAVLQALNIKWGMTHLEFYITEKDIFFGEIALRPPGGFIMDLLGISYGFDPWELFIRVELNLVESELVTQPCYGASVIVHPIAGVVKSIKGEDQVKKLVSLRKFKLNIKPQDIVKKREGVGESYGHVFFGHEDPKQIDQDIDTFYSTFKIEIS
jgi:hypothetical protein